MALLVARFCRFFPSHTIDDVMAMLASRFFALNGCIPRIHHEEEYQALLIHHNGDPQKRATDLLHLIQGKKAPSKAAAMLLKGEAEREETSGEIQAFRERQKAQAAEMKKDPQAWLAKQRELQNQQASLPSTPEP